MFHVESMLFMLENVCCCYLALNLLIPHSTLQLQTDAASQSYLDASAGCQLYENNLKKVHIFNRKSVSSTQFHASAGCDFYDIIPGKPGFSTQIILVDSLGSHLFCFAHLPPAHRSISSGDDV
jgi:hypothetical protein